MPWRRATSTCALASSKAENMVSPKRLVAALQRLRSSWHLESTGFQSETLTKTDTSLIGRGCEDLCVVCLKAIQYSWKQEAVSQRRRIEEGKVFYLLTTKNYLLFAKNKKHQILLTKLFPYEAKPPKTHHKPLKPTPSISSSGSAGPLLHQRESFSVVFLVTPNDSKDSATRRWTDEAGGQRLPSGMKQFLFSFPNLTVPIVVEVEPGRMIHLFLKHRLLDATWGNPEPPLTGGSMAMGQNVHPEQPQFSFIFPNLPTGCLRYPFLTHSHIMGCSFASRKQKAAFSSAKGQLKRVPRSRFATKPILAQTGQKNEETSHRNWDQNCERKQLNMRLG